MFKKPSEYFEGKHSLEVDDTEGPTEQDLHVAVTVLLVETASADQDIDLKEGDAVVELMSQHFGLEQSEIPELVKIAITARKEHNKIDEFVKCINDKFSAEKRQQVLAMVWKVILADGKVDKAEERIAKQLQTRLQLTAEQSDQALRIARVGEA